MKYEKKYFFSDFVTQVRLQNEIWKKTFLDDYLSADFWQKFYK